MIMCMKKKEVAKARWYKNECKLEMEITKWKQWWVMYVEFWIDKIWQYNGDAWMRKKHHHFDVSTDIQMTGRHKMEALSVDGVKMLILFDRLLINLVCLPVYLLMDKIHTKVPCSLEKRGKTPIHFKMFHPCDIFCFSLKINRPVPALWDT